MAGNHKDASLWRGHPPFEQIQTLSGRLGQTAAWLIKAAATPHLTPPINARLLPNIPLTSPSPTQIPSIKYISTHPATARSQNRRNDAALPPSPWTALPRQSCGCVPPQVGVGMKGVGDVCHTTTVHSEIRGEDAAVRRPRLKVSESLEVERFSHTFNPAASARQSASCSVIASAAWQSASPSVIASAARQSASPSVIASAARQSASPSVIASAASQSASPSVIASAAWHSASPSVIASAAWQSASPSVIASAAWQSAFILLSTHTHHPHHPHPCPSPTCGGTQAVPREGKRERSGRRGVCARKVHYSTQVIACIPPQVGLLSKLWEVY